VSESARPHRRRAARDLPLVSMRCAAPSYAAPDGRRNAGVAAEQAHRIPHRIKRNVGDAHHRRQGHLRLRRQYAARLEVWRHNPADLCQPVRARQVRGQASISLSEDMGEAASPRTSPGRCGTHPRSGSSPLILRPARAVATTLSAHHAAETVHDGSFPSRIGAATQSRIIFSMVLPRHHPTLIPQPCVFCVLASTLLRHPKDLPWTWAKIDASSGALCAEGSVRRAGNRVRITRTAYRSAASGPMLWADRTTGELCLCPLLFRMIFPECSNRRDRALHHCRG